MEIIKRIWNYFFPAKKAVEPFEKIADVIVESKVIEQKVSAPIFYFNSHKLSFRKQQLIGKVLIFGKDRFRIHQRISVSKKFKYYVDKLT